MSDDEYIFVAVPPITKGLQKRCTVAAKTIEGCAEEACKTYDLPYSASDPANWELARDINEESVHRNRRLFKYKKYNLDGPYHIEEVLVSE